MASRQGGGGGGRESGASETTLNLQLTNLMRNNESQYVTAVDKPINMPKISWTALHEK